MITRLSEHSIWFPDPQLAEDDGLLAVGGDLSVERLLLAYRYGIFPWFSEGDPIAWYAPKQRFVLFPESLKVSSSTLKIIRSGKFRITHNQAFSEVIRACANSYRKDQDGTWITSSMEEAYIRLHDLGYAYSIEVWEEDLLVGGLYGVKVYDVFCGESMFSKVNNASKFALIYLVQEFDFKLIDCQVHTNHLESLGARFITMEEYLSMLKPS